MREQGKKRVKNRLLENKQLKDRNDQGKKLRKTIKRFKRAPDVSSSDEEILDSKIKKILSTSSASIVNSRNEQKISVTMMTDIVWGEIKFR